MPWEYLLSQCRSAAELGPGRQTLTWSDIRTAIRRIAVPAAQVGGPQYTLVNLQTTFYTRASTIDRTLTILGFTVDVHIQPTSYIWHWGDGTTSTTHVPGRPYPAKDVTHTYVHATAQGAGLPLRVDVEYSARYRVDGTSWVTIPQALMVPGAVKQLPVKQASAVLVGPGG